MSGLSPNARGSLYMAVGSLAYVLNDAVVRLASEQGVGIYQVIAVRGAAMVLLFAAVGLLRGELPRLAHLERMVIGRVAAEVISTALFFTALVRMEFANVQAILQIVPLLVTLAAALLLRERVSARRYVTILVGLVGVLFVIRPATDGFTAWSLVAILSVFAQVAREFATNRVRPGTPALSIALFTATGNTVFGAGLATADGWDPLNDRSLGLIALAAGLLFFGYLFSIQTVRVGDLSVSAPFRYTILLGAIASGVLLFDERPDGWTLLGASIILATGLYAIALDRAETAPARPS